MDENTNLKQEYKESRSKAMGYGGAVYTGGVFAATVIFLSFVLTAFPETAFFIRFLMVLSGIAVGCSAIAFPNALHNWTIEKRHHTIAMVLYYGEIFIVGLNTIVSFSALLFKFAEAELPAWVAWYEPFTIISLVYVIFSWGTLFITDPHSQQRAGEIANLQQFDREIVKSQADYLKSQDGRIAIQAAANQRIRENFGVVDNAPKAWIQNAGAFAPWSCVFCSTGNPGNAGFCSACGSPKGASLQGPTTPPSLPSPAPLNVPMAPRKVYSLRELLDYMGVSADEARSMLDQYGLRDPGPAYKALSAAGYIPADFGDGPYAVAAFSKLFEELTQGAAVRLPARGTARNF